MVDSLKNSDSVSSALEPSSRLVRKNFLLIFLPIVLSLAVVVVSVFSVHIMTAREEISRRESEKLYRASNGFSESLNFAITDLNFLIHSDDMVGYALDPSLESRKRLEHLFSSVSKAKMVFDQVRFIDMNGDERVRVNLVDKVPVASAEHELQNKKYRYYFSDAIGLEPGQVFMSRLDLNIENKKVDIPYKPMIRLVAPVDVGGKRYGVVVLNYLAENLLGRVRREFASDESNGFLVNPQGAWLIGPRRDLEWSFMFDRSDRFQDLYPHTWNEGVRNFFKDTSEATNQLVSPEGVFTLAKVLPPARVVTTEHSDAYWILASRVSSAVWYKDQFVEHVPEASILLLSVIVLGFGSWRLALNRAARQQMDGAYQRRLLDALNESERRNSAVVEASDDVVMTCTETGYIRHANHAAARVFNVPQIDLVGREVSEFLMEPDTISRRQSDGNRKLFERERFETYAVRGTGEGFPAEITLTPIQTEGNTRFSLFIRDITLRRSYEERLKRLANYDPLTGLANRVLILEHLTTALKNSKGPEGPHAVIMGDLDDFRIVNDTLGHVIGDEALKEAAGRIHQQAPPGSLVGRFGGDEFILIVPCFSDRGTAGKVCEAILNAFDRPLVVEGHRLYVGISLGVAFAEAPLDTAASLMQMADTAMYAAKDGGRNTFRTFTKDMHDASARRLAIQTRLAGAHSRGDISLMYQPLIDAKTQRIIGAEALMRWTDAELGSIGPDEFIPVAESTGLIIELGSWALDEACHHARAWRDIVPNFHMAVNLSPVQLIGSDVASSVKSALLKYGLEPQALEIEITEGLLIKDPHESEITLNELAEVGVSISIDDFGTGYSSLSYLHRFPFTTLKIDRMFVMDLPHNEDSRSLVTAILALAQRSNLKVIAEGVEDQEQAKWLTEQGCDILQGYLFSKPLLLDAFSALLENREPPADGKTADKGQTTLKLV